MLLKAAFPLSEEFERGRFAVAWLRGSIPQL